MFSPKFDTLTQCLKILPGVGPKSAQRMALQLLLKQPEAALELAEALAEAIMHIRRCTRCQSLAEEELCMLCANAQRDQKVLCIVESPSDIIAIEQSGVYQGLYYVLGGRLSPLDGIGPEELGLERLFKRLQAEPIDELIIATNTTVEGEVTAHFISGQAKALGIARITRPAQGMPQGGELEYTDSQTIGLALRGRLNTL